MVNVAKLELKLSLVKQFPNKCCVQAQGHCFHLTIIAPVIPATTSDNKGLEEYNKWIKDDSGVVTWLVNSVDMKINTSLLCLKIVKAMWDQLSQIYSRQF